ncbi:hypothetical protein C2G38_2164658 [Gigaspora rosea]|uniref:Uncharacterized protein n=1 Tax=Gigaspora rosea TaxID=44941 RepID=A0A397W0X3_9GLOM|nr:hypothetical protein C2G38_2164658 [Gigaspora rosea]
MDMDMDMDKNLKKGGYKKLGSQPGKMSSRVLITDREERSTIKKKNVFSSMWYQKTDTYKIKNGYGYGYDKNLKKGGYKKLGSQPEKMSSGVLITDREERSTIKSWLATMRF